MTFHVGNLSPQTTREELLQVFQAYGKVASVSLPAERMKDGRAQGIHRRYGFVVMRNREEAQAALQAVEGKPLHGQALSVRAARPRWTPSYPR